MVLWRVIHNAIAHPMMALSDVVETVVDFFHDWTAARAFPEACVVVLEREGQVLAVARRGTFDAWGLPGGTRERGESHKECAARELLEEAGVEVRVSDLRQQYQAMVGDTKVTTFSAERWTGEPLRGDAGPVQWVSWAGLLQGPFARYNSDVRAVLRTRGDVG